MAIIKPSEAFPSADWASGDVRSYMKDQTIIAVDTVADVNDNNFEQARWIYVKAKGAFYRLNLASVAADDGDSVLHDNLDRRYEKQPTAAAGAISFTPAAGISSTNVQDALEELAGDISGGTAIVQADTGDWFEDDGAIVNRMERLFVGAARAYDAETVANDADFLSAFQVANSKGPYAAIAQSYFANDESSAYAIIAKLVAAQSLGKTAFAIGTFEVAVNNETGSDVHTFGGAVEAHRLASAGVTIGREFQIINHGSLVNSGPYGITTAAGRSIAITMGSGAAHAGVATATAFMTSFFDTAGAYAGWIVGDGAIVAGDGDSKSKIIKAPLNYRFAWYSTGDTLEKTIGIDGSGVPVVGDAAGVDTPIVLTSRVMSDTLAGLVEAAVQSEMEAASSTTLAVTPGRQHFHPSAAKMWGSVTYSAGVPTLNTNYNITSITDGGVGVLTITIATDFSSANWAEDIQPSGNGANGLILPIFGAKAAGSVAYTFFGLTTGAAADPDRVSFSGFGDQ